MLRGARVFLAIVLAGIFMSGCESDSKRPAYQYLPDMVESVPYDAFAPNPNFKDGKTLQGPPAGTIPRGFFPYPYAATPEGAEQAGKELVNPVVFSPQALARGEKVYRSFCLICHGETGQGDGPLIPKYPNPPSFTSKTLMQYSDGRLFHIMTVGSGQMASYASQIRAADRWKLIFYLRKLQGKTPGGESMPTAESTALVPESRPAVETLPSGGKAP